MRRMLINAVAGRHVYTIARSGYIQFNRAVIRLREFDNSVGVQQNTFDWILRCSLNDLMYTRTCLSVERRATRVLKDKSSLISLNRKRRLTPFLSPSHSRYFIGPRSSENWKKALRSRISTILSEAAPRGRAEILLITLESRQKPALSH